MKRITAILLLCTLLIPSAAAAQDFTTSPWAVETVAKSEALTLLHDVFSDENLQVPATRDEFRKLAMRYLIVQEQQDKLEDLAEYYLSEKDAQGNMKLIFQDLPNEQPRVTDRGSTIAYSLKLVQGRDTNHFDPEANLTREEAAVMLTRAYEALGGELPEAVSMPFPDSGAIAPWAWDSVAVLHQWGILNGKENGCFDPKGDFTREQCAAAFLRLYENAPVSRLKGNVPARFTYDQIIHMLDGQYSRDTDKIIMRQRSRWEGPKATMIHESIPGVMVSAANTYFVYQDGRVRYFDLDFHNIWGMMTSSVQLSDGQFSDDGNTFTCTLTLSSDIQPGQGTSEDATPRKAGVYQVTVDVESLQSTAQWVGAA